MNKKLFAILMFFLAVTLCFAENWQIEQQDSNSFVATRSDGKIATINVTDNVNEQVIERVKNCLDTVLANPYIDSNKITANITSETQFRFVVHANSFNFGGQNLAQYFPAGIGFYYDSALFYDATLKVGELMPRLNGAYVSPDDFATLAKNAVDFPELYMYDSYILARLERLENAVMALSKKGLFSKAAPVDESLVLAVRSLYNENPDYTAKEMQTLLKQQGINATPADISAIRMVYLGLFE